MSVAEDSYLISFTIYFLFEKPIWKCANMFSYLRQFKLFSTKNVTSLKVQQKTITNNFKINQKTLFSNKVAQTSQTDKKQITNVKHDNQLEQISKMFFSTENEQKKEKSNTEQQTDQEKPGSQKPQSTGSSSNPPQRTSRWTLLLIGLGVYLALETFNSRSSGRIMKEVDWTEIYRLLKEKKVKAQSSDITH